ncbi:CoA transferase [uncultured Sphingomonas sp.]|uniref:CoA transferase n=1 Tax=uncultured Sphingomonas sp. TaxID=158754 RepID=UPI0035CCA4EC
MTYSLLSGVRIVESSAFIAAPLCGLTLAQYGADVIRFDMIGGGIDYRRLPIAPAGRSVYWTSLNKAKRSIAIDARRPEGRELLQALVTAPGSGGGILLSNIPAGFLAHDTLATMRPDLISCLIEGNFDGSTAVDYTVNCATGYPMITGHGSPDRPVNQALPAWDVACAYQAAFGLMLAIHRRSVTGQGQALRLALSDVAFGVLSHLGLLTEASLAMPPRQAIGNDIYGAFGRDFATVDGRRVMVAAISSRQWQALVEACAIGPAVAALEGALRVDFASEAVRFDYREVIAALVKPWIAGRSLGEVAETFDRLSVCWGSFQSVAELVAMDRRASELNPLFTRIDTPGVGMHLAAGATIRLADVERADTEPAPLLGQHTDDILGDVLGLADGQIGRLHDAGIVAGPARDLLNS